MSEAGIHRRIQVQMWGDLKFRRLTPLKPSGQGLWVYLLCGKFTIQIPGIVPANAGEMSSALRWPPKAFAECLAEILAEGMARYDDEAGLFWLPRGVIHNPPRNPNVVTSWRRAWPLIPECDLKTQIWRDLRLYCEERGESWLEAFDEAIAPPSPKEDKDQEEDQDKEKEKENDVRTPHGSRSSASTKAAKAITERVLEYLNRKAGRQLTAPPYLKLVKRLLEQGHNFREIKLVVWWAIDQWKGTDMAKFITPNTLFKLGDSSGKRNFPQYLAEAAELWQKKHNEKFDRDGGSNGDA